jgi:hypothetical protein
MTTQDVPNQTRKATLTRKVPNVLVSLAATDDMALLKRPQLARAINVSPRTIDNFVARKIIPAIRISTRCVRFDLASVLAALRKFEVKETGR